MSNSASAERTPVKGFVPPAARPWKSNTSLDQSELQRLKSLRLAAQKEAMLINSWRSQKLKEHTSAEIAAEDDAFDRYMKNISLLEDVFSLHAGSLEGISLDGQLVIDQGEVENGLHVKEFAVDEQLLMEGMRLRLGANSKRKEESRLRLKKVIDGAILKLKKPDQEVDISLDDEDHQAAQAVLTAGSSWWDTKRFKAHTEDGKECLKRVEAFDMLLQKVNQARGLEHVNSCVYLYKETLGCSLRYLLPHISLTEEDSTSRNATKNLPFLEEESGKTSENESAAVMEHHSIVEADDPMTVDNEVPSKDSRADSIATSSHIHDLPNGNEYETQANAQTSEGASCSEQMIIDSRPIVKDFDSGVSKLERLFWHRKFIRGTGFWKVHASEETIQNVCASFLKSDNLVVQL